MRIQAFVCAPPRLPLSLHPRWQVSHTWRALMRWAPLDNGSERDSGPHLRGGGYQCRAGSSARAAQLARRRAAPWPASLAFQPQACWQDLAKEMEPLVPSPHSWEVALGEHLVKKRTRRGGERGWWVGGSLGTGNQHQELRPQERAPAPCCSGRTLSRAGLRPASRQVLAGCCCAPGHVAFSVYLLLDQAGAPGSPFYEEGK